MADSMLSRRFGVNLRQARGAMSQEEAGIRAELHRTEIGLLERGERVPRIDTLVKLAYAVGVKIECPLFEGIEWTPGVYRRGGFEIVPVEHR